MRVFITGGHGQLGQALKKTTPKGIDAIILPRDSLDITHWQNLQKIVAEIQPQVIINAAAYTAVDRAEQARAQAFKVNAQGAAHLANVARANKARLIHISTDFVFDGKKSRPYHPSDLANPLSVYGASKWEGERQVQTILGNDALIVRTAWVYSGNGNNFVKTMLRLMGERDTLGVVADQVGSPTWARGLAKAVWCALEQGLGGLHHWTDAGVASWYDFAQAIQEEAVHCGLLQRSIALHPITSENYPTPAVRPAFSVLDKTLTWQALGYTADHWRVALRTFLQEERTKNG